MPLSLVMLTPAHVMPVFRNVGQVRKIAERANHTHRLIPAQVLQQAVQGAAGLGVALKPVGHRELAHALDQLEGVLALLLADHFAENAAEQADILDQRQVLGGGSGRAARRSQ